jgi:hypothetical protein
MSNPTLTKTQAYEAGNWTTITTSGNPVPGLTAEDPLEGLHLWLRQILETEDEQVTPTLSSLAVEVDTAAAEGDPLLLDYYPAHRHADLVVSVDATPTADFTLQGRTIIPEPSMPPGTVTATYTAVEWPTAYTHVAANGDPIPGFAPDDPLTGLHCWLKQTLTSPVAGVTPELHSLSMAVNGFSTGPTTVRLGSVRDGLESHQAHEHTFTWEPGA